MVWRILFFINLGNAAMCTAFGHYGIAVFAAGMALWNMAEIVIEKLEVIEDEG
jgi:hypothetical protein